MVFTPDPLAVNDFNRVVLAWIVLEIAVVYGTVLASTEDFRGEHDLNFVARERDDFATRFKLLLLLFLHLTFLLSFFFYIYY